MGNDRHMDFRSESRFKRFIKNTDNIKCIVGWILILLICLIAVFALSNFIQIPGNDNSVLNSSDIDDSDDSVDLDGVEEDSDDLSDYGNGYENDSDLDEDLSDDSSEGLYTSIPTSDDYDSSSDVKNHSL